MKFETIGFDEDHVHFLIESLTTTYSPAKIVQVVKSITARELFKRHPIIKEELYNGEFWSDGGYIGTVGEGINGDIIRSYIKRQGRKGDQLKLINFPDAPQLATGRFTEVGYEPNSEIVDKEVKKNKANEIIINEKNQTSVGGMFAAGDVTNVSVKQIIVSAGEGAKASISAAEYLYRMK